jgi:hypothetical protein
MDIYKPALVLYARNFWDSEKLTVIGFLLRSIGKGLGEIRNLIKY